MEEQFDQEWPVCPQCGARRVVRCPICKTSSTNFPWADAEYAAMGEDDTPAEAASCGCGGLGCATAGHADMDSATEEPSAAPEVEPAAPMLVCSTCDEPFVPEYPRRCEWCGHEFQDGYDVDDGVALEQISPQAMAVIALLAALGIGLAVYFALII